MKQLTAVLGLATLLGCGAPPDASTTEPLRKLRVSLSVHLSWGPLMIAQAEGFFRDEGLDVEFVTLMRPQEALVALVSGDIDVRPGPINASLLSAITRGAPVRIVAGQGNLVPNTCTYFGIVLRPGLDTTGTPNVRRIQAGQDGATRFAVNQMLARRNVRVENVEAVRLPESVLQMAMENGSLDAAAVSEPALTRLRKVGTMWLAAEEAVPDFQWGVIAFGERLLTRERDTGHRFIRAYQRGVEQYRGGKTDRNVAIIAEATAETAEHTREVCWPEFRSDARINWESVTAYAKWALAEGIMERTITPEQAFDSSFVSAATLANGRTP